MASKTVASGQQAADAAGRQLEMLQAALMYVSLESVIIILIN